MLTPSFCCVYRKSVFSAPHPLVMGECLIIRMILFFYYFLCLHRMLTFGFSGDCLMTSACINNVQLNMWSHTLLS